MNTIYIKWFMISIASLLLLISISFTIFILGFIDLSGGDQDIIAIVDYEHYIKIEITCFGHTTLSNTLYKIKITDLDDNQLNFVKFNNNKLIFLNYAVINEDSIQIVFTNDVVERNYDTTIAISLPKKRQ